MQLTLFLPDLVSASASASIFRMPALETLLARADTRSAPQNGDLGVLAEIFGLPADAVTVAPFTRLADTGKRDDGVYFRADPAHLAADRDQLVMLPQSLLQVQPQEASALAETFNRTYAADGYGLEVPHPERWYLRLPAAIACVTHAPASLAGQPVIDYMPAGDGATLLKQLMNEVQMLFHGHAVNQARETAGIPVINSFWPWGGGRLPVMAARGPACVITDLPLVLGLARFAASRCEPWPAALDERLDVPTLLLAVDIRDAADKLSDLEQRLAAPLLARLHDGGIESLQVYPGGSRIFQISRAGSRRFWRRRRPLSEILQLT